MKKGFVTLKLPQIVLKRGGTALLSSVVITMHTENYTVESLELHLFFGRIMKEHS